MSNANVNTDHNQESDLVEKVVLVKRVAKVVKGGRRFSFAVLVVIGNGKGRVGWGLGKASEVGDARKKAVQAAKRAMIHIPMKEGRTLHHDSFGKYGTSTVVVRTAPSGTGIIAGGATRAVLEVVGMHDVVAKSIGSTNPHNLVKATFDALQNTTSPRNVANRRGKRTGEIKQSAAKETKETAE